MRFKMSLAGALLSGDVRALAKAISLAEDRDPQATELVAELQPNTGKGYLVGLTGATLTPDAIKQLLAPEVRFSIPLTILWVVMLFELVVVRKTGSAIAEAY